MNQICPSCPPTRQYGPDEFLCPTHLIELRPYTPPVYPGPGASEPSPAEPSSAGPPPEPVSPAAPVDAEAWSPMVCWNCGTGATPGNVECLRPGCNKPLSPPALVITFEYGQVEVQPGEHAELGREGQYRPLFRSFPNVSRRHAMVGADIDGTAWVEPLRDTTNGTFVNGLPIRGSDRQSLRHRDRIRLARHAEGVVRIFRR